MGCNNCENMESKTAKPRTITYVAHEVVVARLDNTIQRLWIALLVAIFAILLSNALWLCAWCQYDYSSEEIIVEQDAKDGGNANYIGNDGDIINGVSEGYNKAS